jgi:hypothetical protein
LFANHDVKCDTNEQLSPYFCAAATLPAGMAPSLRNLRQGIMPVPMAFGGMEMGVGIHAHHHPHGHHHAHDGPDDDNDMPHLTDDDDGVRDWNCLRNECQMHH